MRFPLLIALASALAVAARADVLSQTVGFVSADHAAGASGLALPLVAATRFTGRVSSNSAAALVAAGAGLNIGARLTAGQPCYVEITSGTLVGHRFDVDVSATIAAGSAAILLDLSPSSFSTLSTLGTDALAGAGFALRRHATLATLQAGFSPALTGSDNPAVADAIELYEPSAGGYTLHQLRADGVTWRRPGSTDDERARVIPPDQSVVVLLHSGARQSRLTGSVRGHAFRLNLAAGQQAFATGFPVPLSLAAIGASTTGSAAVTSADFVRVLPAGTSAFVRYHLGADGTSWTTDDGSPDVSAAGLLSPDAALLVSRTQAVSSLLINPPGTP